ncbi:HoxN/HupN/NixA family nickel/cobalt transporter [Rhodoplanes sp. Z2-YC6860]|uniref:HoxN/HupN/NixA family nickel/cobalt transporter n=1 Tax=Rhodoplanes sp. Z2-YC6860 TaxID=674703 RepID=UPI00078B99F1|nr:HoxN/HupN/NixA family nickel/cobalt transporter [Rhodoplanes sp. Z2-YC6860]AMN42721.1 high-affinity nickel-transporter [Rhodoplanes sp. Z2-YC6860]
MPLGRRVFFVLGALIAANVAVWVWALAVLSAHTVSLGTAVLAYGLGLRHALDADHIAAIDNVTRNLMQRGKQPLTVGLWFALGHSTVVMLASLAVALAAHSLIDAFAPYREIGGLVGTLASVAFLLGIAAANASVLRSLVQSYFSVRRGGSPGQITAALQPQGFLARLISPVSRLVTESYHLFPVGFLFALGFDTASEIGLFAMAAQQSGSLSPGAIIIFPALFMAGMMLVDTADGILMVGAYGWASRNPASTLIYNIVITSISIVVAAVVGGIEAFGLLADRLNLQGSTWRAIADLNEHLGAVGIFIVCLMAAIWLVSMLNSRQGADRRIETERGASGG